MVTRNDNIQGEDLTTFGTSPENVAKILEMGLEQPTTFKEFFKLIGIRHLNTEETSIGRQYDIMDAFFNSCSNDNTPRQFTPIEEEIVSIALEKTAPSRRDPKIILSNEELRDYCNLWKRYEEKFTQATKKYHDITNAMEGKK